MSLLSCVGKLFERAIFKHVFNFLSVNNLISLKQSGFIPGDSTVYQLTHLYHLFVEALDKQKDIRVVFCDISKAFDRVWHAGLLESLNAMAFRVAYCHGSIAISQKGNKGLSLMDRTLPG